MVEFVPTLWTLMGCGCLLYLLSICLYCGFLPAFSWFWMILGIAGILFGWVLQRPSIKAMGGYSRFCQAVFWMMAAVFLCFLVFFGILYRDGNRKPQLGADYLIVLGAKVKGDVPSKALQGRIWAAYSYLQENPETKAVLTGGKGRGEFISESSCMERELVALGIGKDRLFKEEKSTTTLENIEFAGQKIKDRQKKIVIVTSDFHVKRGVRIAKEAGYQKVEGLGDASVPIMCLHYYTRETLSWVKYEMYLLTSKGK
ncbi:MAG: YdcF family protein [Lachnospiraceae bacterium]|nr:YdcF family protein [Lachnospiraceae bacterium]